MKENSERQVFNYKNVPITIIRYNGKPYVDCRNIGRLLKRCISGWVKDNRNQIAIYCNGNGIKVNKAIITNRWILEDIALMYAKSISNDFFEAMKQNLGSETTYDPSCVGGWSRSFTLYCESGNVFEYHGNYCTDSNENSLTTNIVEELLTKCQIVI